MSGRSLCRNYNHRQGNSDQVGISCIEQGKPHETDEQKCQSNSQYTAVAPSTRKCGTSIAARKVDTVAGRKPKPASNGVKPYTPCIYSEIMKLNPIIAPTNKALAVYAFQRTELLNKRNGMTGTLPSIQLIKRPMPTKRHPAIAMRCLRR